MRRLNLNVTHFLFIYQLYFASQALRTAERTNTYTNIHTRIEWKVDRWRQKQKHSSKWQMRGRSCCSSLVLIRPPLRLCDDSVGLIERLRSWACAKSYSKCNNLVKTISDDLYRSVGTGPKLEQELIRRWDSKRELFTTISHVLQNTKKEPTSFNQLDDC